MSNALGRFIEAVKGVGKVVGFLEEQDARADDVRLLPEAGSHCPSPAPSGYRCVLREPHEHCIVERTR